ncbi:amidohydrolase [Marivirga tractuosa]|uniref:Amidohydrolase 3 n=1 Tax=Marivirga tractuosa (strain ATCC 23168 / DSM 4126 / NBRC 15989 / NCIMB 1408 / VKM B-1430 / H-43) TaxID=643867 RepID=E4TU96_MARTH|nr:amidohydrolase [Marivirga tractuosa]ADR21024.1 Amidohydrolase 3 [Marivirga tractuosa DSM 4126]BDD14521.1 amidohydrolase [Marivirga tractuosa]
MNKLLLSLTLILIITSCSSREKVDAIYFNGTVYTVNANFEKAEAFAIKDGKFIAVGSSMDIRNQYQANEEIDLMNSPVYPGFIDGHAHFIRYAKGLHEVDLYGTTSFNELIQRLQKHVEKYPEESTVLGLGWDQNNWEGKQFPTKDTLDLLFPNKVVMLRRVDAHAVLTNQKGLDLAGVTANTKVSGGEVLLKEDRQPSGVLIDNAMNLLMDKIPAMNSEQTKELIREAQGNCFAVGITSLAEAGLDKSQIDLLDEMQKDSLLKMRIYAMINPTPENMEYYFSNGHYKTDYLNVRSFKIYGDGALGSRGACLIAPYSDDPDNYGFLRSEPQVFDSLAKVIFAKDFQMNTHCIGDSANRAITNIYAKYLKGKNDRRWRIEHAQVLAENDFSKFGDYNILPSVQPTHATSDMDWAHERLGEERVKNAYAYQELLKQNGRLVLGSDFPVEDINPIYGFHAAVARQDNNNLPEGGFQSENSLSRIEALKGMTSWAAFGQFEDKEKGSIAKGKWADFVILDQDIMEVPQEELRTTKVIQTHSAGEKVYELK